MLERSSLNCVKIMFSFDASSTNLLLTAAVAGLFVGFVILLLKLKPSTVREEITEPEPDEIIVQSQKQLRIPLGVSQTSPDRKIDVPEASERKIVEVGATAAGASFQTSQDIAPLTSVEKNEHPNLGKTQASIKQSSHSSTKDCLHFFGYLHTFPKNSPIPDECFGCEKIVDCLVTKSPSKGRK